MRVGVLICFFIAVVHLAHSKDLDLLLKESTMGCFEMKAYYVDNKDVCIPAEEYTGKIYAMPDVQYAEYSFATVFINRQHHLLLNHIEKSATLSLLDMNEKPAKSKSKKIKIDGVELLPTQLEYYIESERVFEDGSRAIIMKFKSQYVHYEYVMIHLDNESKVRSILYSYGSNPDWKYSELEFSRCSVTLQEELKSKSISTHFIQWEGKEHYSLKPPYDEYHFQQVTEGSLSDKKRKL